LRGYLRNYTKEGFNKKEIIQLITLQHESLSFHLSFLLLHLPNHCASIEAYNGEEGTNSAFLAELELLFPFDNPLIS